MHLYWRVFEELKWLGEMAVIHDPSLKRSFLHWLKTHETSLIMAEQRSMPRFPEPEVFGVTPSMN